jgi:hypothetical protein
MLPSLTPPVLHGSCTPSAAGLRRSAGPPFVLGETYADTIGTLCTIPIPATAPVDKAQIHPSVVYFPSGKGGYKYWMASSPYGGDLGNALPYENPCIHVSNDGETWVVPAGVTNPVIPYPNQSTEGGYNADPHLYWDGSQFILLWTWQEGTALWPVMISTSSDGIAWSAKAQLFASPSGKRLCCSSIARLADGTWRVWATDITAAPDAMVVLTAATLAGPWTPTVCTFSHTITAPWHSEVRRYGSGFVMALGIFTGAIYRCLLATSSDGIAWTVAANYPYPHRWDATLAAYSAYKSSIVLGPWFGTGKIGRIWSGNGAWTQIKVADLDRPPVANLADGYLSAAVAGAIAATPPYVIGDTFTRANGALGGRAATSGQAWVTYGISSVIASNQLAWGGAASRNYISLGSNDGVVGVRFAVLPAATGYVDVCFRGSRATASPNRMEVIYQGAAWKLRTYNGAWIEHAAWTSPYLATAPDMDGLELVISYRGKAIKVWMDGHLVASATQPDADYAALTGYTEVEIGMFDANSRIDRFFAHT